MSGAFYVHRWKNYSSITAFGMPQVYQAVNDLPRDDKVLLLARAGISQADFDSPDPLVPKEKYQQLAKSGELYRGTTSLDQDPAHPAHPGPPGLIGYSECHKPEMWPCVRGLPSTTQSSHPRRHGRPLQSFRSI